ncbi:MAG TPA: hypothetical protein VGN23_01405 [Verrucomicrobiae bacterium]|jgi:hypothetical protein
MIISDTEIAVSGKFFRVARLRHEWFDFLEDPMLFIETLRSGKPVADLFTYLQESHIEQPDYPYYREMMGASVLTIQSFDDWWSNLHFKARNKARKAEKCGVEIRTVTLDDDFVRGVEKIYSESPLRQGRRFTHYGKDFATIKKDLSSFLDESVFVGAYHKGRLIGFMKLFLGNGIIRIIHIIATLEDRDTCAMDALIARAVKICDEKKFAYLHYGDWASRGLGAFRAKYDFQRQECPRYFVPLTALGRFMLGLRLHRPLRERLPQPWADRLVSIRNHWNAVRYGAKGALET